MSRCFQIRKQTDLESEENDLGKFEEWAEQTIDMEYYGLKESSDKIEKYSLEDIAKESPLKRQSSLRFIKDNKLSEPQNLVKFYTKNKVSDND